MLPSESVARLLRPSRALHVKAVERAAVALCDAKRLSAPLSLLSRRRSRAGCSAANAPALRVSPGLNLVGGSSTPYGRPARTTHQTLRRPLAVAWFQAYPVDALHAGEAPARAGYFGKPTVCAGSEAESTRQRLPYLATRAYRVRIFSFIPAGRADAPAGHGSPRRAGHEVLSNSQT